MKRVSKKWLEIRNQAEITEIFINGDIENDAYNDGIMEWFGLKDTNVYPLEVKKALAEANNKEVHVHINSYGGEVFAGVAICNMLKNYKGKTVAYVDGLAASAASIIAFGCDEVIIPNNAYLMIHRVSCGIWGNADDLRTQIEVLEKLEDGIANTYEEKAVEGVTREDILNLMKEEISQIINCFCILQKLHFCIPLQILIFSTSLYTKFFGSSHNVIVFLLFLCILKTDTQWTKNEKLLFTL
mgnify:CR=1 FL=1